jgi:uncharacterized protein (DUF1330 family)
MTVLNIAFTEIKDAEKMQEYIAGAAPLMQEYGAEVVVRGRYLKTIVGEGKTPHITRVFRFPDMATAEAFYGCDEYKALIPVREAAGKMSFNFYEE